MSLTAIAIKNARPKAKPYSRRFEHCKYALP